MPSLYIDRRTTDLKLDGEVLICYEKGERIATIPLAPIERLYLKGDVNVQASLLAKLGEKGIGVVFLQGRKNEPMLFLSQPHNDAERRLNQYRLAQNNVFCLAVAKNIVLQKSLAQQRFLAGFAKNQQKTTAYIVEFNDLIHLIAEQTSLDSLRGIEGRMAAVYFSTLAEMLPPELGFGGRNRRPPRDPFNATLSLGYTLLYSEATLALYGAGLDPYIGFFHSLHFGRKSLACDLMEAIRPQFDQWLAGCFSATLLTPDHFSQTNEGCLLGKEGRVVFYTEFEKVATKWRSIFEKQAYEWVRLVSSYQSEFHHALFDEYHLAQMRILAGEACDI